MFFKLHYRHKLHTKCLKHQLELLLLQKGNAIPVKGWTGPEGSRKSRFSTYKDSRCMKVVGLSALRTSRLYPQEIFLVLISVRG